MALSTDDKLRFGTKKGNQYLHSLLSTKSNIMCTTIHELAHMQGGASYGFGLFMTSSERMQITAKQELKAFYAEVSSKWWKGTTDDYKKDLIGNVVRFLNDADEDVAKENVEKFNKQIGRGQFKQNEDGKYIHE